MEENIKEAFINELGFEDKEGTPPDAEQIALAECYLEGFINSGTKKKSTYALKHNAEKASGRYITNGAMIQALINRGFEVAREAEGRNGTVFISPIKGSEDDNIVKQVCSELSMTQKELAAILDVSEPTIAKWNAGEIPKMAKLALEQMLLIKEYEAKLQKIKDFKEFIGSI